MGGSSTVTVGYKYLLGVHMVLCHGPVDGTYEIIVDGRTAWSGWRAYSGDLNVNAPALFGGEDREGGVSGTVNIAMGESTQTPNTYLQEQLGTPLPAFRGVVSAILEHVYMGMNPYLKSWSFRMQRIHTTSNGDAQWYDEKCEIPGPSGDVIISDMNFAANVGAVIRPSDGLTYPGIVLTGGFTEDDVIALEHFTGMTYQAWSAWAVTPDEWSNTIVVVDGNGVESTYYNNWHDSAAGAENYMLGKKIILHGSDSYTILIFDSAYTDNRGGISYLVSFGSFPDMNPSHIIRECLTDNIWGMGYQATDIDDTSFTASADTLYDEGMGMSLTWDRQIPIEDFIKEILKHINATLYVDRNTGKFVLKLIRSDYVLGDLVTLDENDIDKVKDSSRPTVGELVNSVTVNFWDPGSDENASLTVQDPALIQMQGAEINTTVQYPGFTNTDIAAKVGLRDLRTLSTPLLSCAVYATRKAANFNIGDVFIMTWPDLQIDALAVRIREMGLGDATNNTIKLVVVEDVFAPPTAATISSPSKTEWSNPVKDPRDIDYRLVFELPYYELVQILGQTDIDSRLASNPDLGFVGGAAVRPDASIFASFWVDDGTGYVNSGTVQFCGSATLLSEISPIDTSISFDEMTDLSLVDTSTHAQIGTELVSVTAIDPVAGTATFGRGVLDSPPRAHAAGDRIFFWDVYNGFSAAEFISSDDLDVKMTPNTGGGVLDVALATLENIIMGARAIRPYAPGQFKIDGSYYPASVVSKNITVTWAHRDRVQQTAGTLYDHTYGDIGPESGTTYTIKVKNESGAVEQTITGISGKTQAVTLAVTSAIATLELYAVRSGYESFLPASVTFTWPYSAFLLFNEEVSLSSPDVWWRFGEASGSVAADEIGSNDGTYNGSPTLGVTSLTLDGDADTAVHLDGSSQSIQLTGIGSLLNGASSVSCEILVQPDVVPSVNQDVMNTIIDSGNFGLFVRFDGTGIFFGGRSVGSEALQATTYAFSVVANRTYHIVAVNDYVNDVINLYLNGELVDQTAVTFTNTTYTFGTPGYNDFVGGSITPTNFFDGIVDEASFYAKEIDAVEAIRHAVAAFGKAYYGDVMRLHPVAYWRLGEASGTTAADETGVNDATYVSSPTFGASSLIAELGDTAIELNGTDQYLALPNNLVNATASWSFEAWINITLKGANLWHTIFSDYQTVGGVGGFSIRVNESAGVLYLQALQTCSTTQATQSGLSGGVVAGAIAHIVAVWDPAAKRFDLYVNGVLVTLSTDTPGVGTIQQNSPSTAEIGRIPQSTGGQYFKGIMDEASVYNKALTAAQIADHYVRGAFASYETLVMSKSPLGYWKLDESTGTTAADSSGNGYDCTYNSMAGLGLDGIVPDYLAADFEADTPSHVDGTDVAALEPTAGSIAIHAWIKIESIDNRIIVNKGASSASNGTYQFQVTSSGNIRFTFYRGTGGNEYFTGNIVMSVGEWYHVAMTHTWGSATSTKLWINGVSETGISWVGQDGTGTPITNSYPFKIGARSSDNAYPFDGLIQQVVFDNKLYTDEDVLKHYRKGVL